MIIACVYISFRQYEKANISNSVICYGMFHNNTYSGITGEHLYIALIIGITLYCNFNHKWCYDDYEL